MKSSESKERQHNGQKKKDKRTNYDLQNITQKLKIEQYDLHQKRWVNSGAQVLLTVRSTQRNYSEEHLSTRVYPPFLVEIVLLNL
jgi:translation initiation factor IF-3